MDLMTGPRACLEGVRVMSSIFFAVRLESLRRCSWFSLLAVLFSVSVWGGILNAQSQGDQKESSGQGVTEEKGGTSTQEKDTHREQLIEIADSISDLSLEIETLTKELKAKRGYDDALEELGSDLRGLRNRRSRLLKHFEEIVTEVELEDVTGSSESEQMDFEAEIRSLLAPLINEVKRLTERPREIEKLKTDLLEARQKEEFIDDALSNVKSVLKEAKNERLEELLDDVKRSWQQRKQESRTQLTILSQKLKQKEGEQPPLSESIARVFQMFFRSRGRNLVLAFCSAGLLWLILSRFHAWFLRSKYLRQRRERFFVRFLSIGTYLSTFVGSLVVFLLTLYLFGDWVLLMLTVILVLGVVWTSKQALTRFWGQASLVLNIGPVREGEVVVLEGLPWRVRRLNLYSQLVNPNLTGGTLRLPAKELLGMRSRPFDGRERWFPTREGDWILIDDLYGKVVLQSPELVLLKSPGGTEHSFATSNFVQSSIHILSNGFRLSQVIGIDYSHQVEVVGEVLVQMNEFIQSGLKEAGFGNLIEKLSVEFQEASASSLDLAILIDCDGKLADRYDFLSRFVQNLSVQACNHFEWVIPFQQLTVHMSKE